MLKVRLRRMGSRHRPFYRVVVSDSRQTPTGSAVEELGFYDPRKAPSIIQIDTERVDFWVGRGAQLSESVARLVRRANSGLAEAPVPATETEKSAEAPAAEATEAAETPAEAAEASAEVAEAPAEAASESSEDEEAPAAEASQG